MQALEEMGEGNQTILDELFSLDYNRKPVSPDEFFTDPYYVGEQGKSLYKIWRDELRYVLTEPGVYELALTGSIGSGKTTAAVAALCYKLYYLSCLRNPHEFYGLMKGSLIAFGLFSVFKYKAANTSWHMLNQMVRNSPYFREHFPADPKKTAELVFPNHVYVTTGATELQAIGENLFSVVIDEADFMREATTAAQRGQAEELHQAVRRRTESRFAQLGKMPPGIIILVSSKKTVDSYIERYVEAHVNDPTVHICDYAIWDAKPDKYPKERFRVWLNDGMLEGRVLTATEPAPAGGTVLFVPDSPSVRRAFEENVVAAARDLGGVSARTAFKFITNPSSVLESVDKSREHPFSSEQVVLDYKTKNNIEDALVCSKLLRVAGSRYQPLLDPEAPRYVHVDIGLSRDSAGIAVVHAGKAVAVTRFNPDGSANQMVVPTIVVDLMLRIKPPSGSQIDLSKIRQFIVMLAEYGYPLKKISYDGYQSADSIQLLQKMGYNAELLSVDKKPDPYLSMRQAILEHRMTYYRYAPFLDEVLNLLEDPKSGKIDHPRTMRALDSGLSVVGSKDVSDAVAACCQHIMEDESLVVAPPSSSSAPPRREDRVIDPNDFSWIVDKTQGDHRIVGLR